MTVEFFPSADEQSQVWEFIDQIEVSRKKLKELRMLFWEDNKRNFKKNVQKIIALTPPPKDWKVYVSASNFLFDKNIFVFRIELGISGYEFFPRAWNIFKSNYGGRGRGFKDLNRFP